MALRKVRCKCCALIRSLRRAAGGPQDVPRPHRLHRTHAGQVQPACYAAPVGAAAQQGRNPLAPRPRYGEELHLLRRGRREGTRAAIDSRRAHGIDERAVQTCIREATAVRHRRRERFGGLETCSRGSSWAVGFLSQLTYRTDPVALSESCGQTQIAAVAIARLLSSGSCSAGTVVRAGAAMTMTTPR